MAWNSPSSILIINGTRVTDEILTSDAPVPARLYRDGTDATRKAFPLRATMSTPGEISCELNNMTRVTLLNSKTVLDGRFGLAILRRLCSGCRPLNSRFQQLTTNCAPTPSLIKRVVQGCG